MTESMNPALVFGLGGLVLGALVGLLIGRLIWARGAQNRRVSQQLDDLQNEYLRYQAQVNEHFMETAHRVRRLNDAYRDMHEHLSSGASRLCSDGEWKEALDPAAFKQRLDYNLSSTDGVEPPRDYAPKADPEERGTLAEDYGLSEEKEKS
ncbi:DUF1043 family protein [Marinobacteraceae bacterium S3BR75-40.1]